MIKYSKILALFAALTFAFALAGCGEDAPETSGIGKAKVQTTLLDLKADLAKLNANETDPDKIFDGEITTPAGFDQTPPRVTFSVTSDKALKVTTTADWAGFDIKYNPALGGLKAGDVIEISGDLTDAAAADQILLNLNHSGWSPLQGWNPAKSSLEADAKFSKTFTLEADDVAKILTANPQAIRIRMNNVGSFTIEQLKVTGLR